MERSLEFNWSKATLLLTVFAVIIALLSLFMEWYSCTLSYVDRYWYTLDYEFYVVGVHQSAGITFYDSISNTFDEVGSVIGAVAALIIVWAFFSMVYISAVFDGESGYYRGWVLIVLAFLPLVVYAMFIRSAVEAGTSAFIESVGISMGPLVALFAAMLQAVAVTARNIQVLNPRLSAGENVMTEQQIRSGDLPER